MEEYHVVDLNYENLKKRLEKTNISIGYIEVNRIGDNIDYLPLEIILEGEVGGKSIYIKTSYKVEAPFYSIKVMRIDHATINGNTITNSEAEKLIFEFMPYLKQKAKEQYESHGKNIIDPKRIKITKL